MQSKTLRIATPADVPATGALSANVLPTVEAVGTILPTDFANFTDDSDYRRWTAGKMRHVIDALAGVPVIVTTDKNSGSTLVGAQLTGLADEGRRVVVQYRADAVHAVHHHLWDIGEAITPLYELHMPGTAAKWRAIKAYRAEQTTAIDAARKAFPDVDRYGVWSAVPVLRSTYVTYTPHKRVPSGKDGGRAWHGQYHLATGVVRPVGA